MRLFLPNAVLAAAALLALTACAAAGPQTPRAAAADTSRTARATPPPAEDLARYRLPLPAPPAPAAAAPTAAPALAPPAARAAAPAPTAHNTAAADQRLRDQAYTNQAVRYTQGYRVLVYLGLERERAMSIRRTIIGRYPTETDYLVFKAPVYRLYIGDYTTKLEAERGLARLRGLTPKLELESTSVLLNKNP